MPKQARVLGPAAVAKLAQTTAVGGVPGLLLQVIGGSRSWVLRTVANGKRREFGLGSYPAVSVYAARAKASDLKDTLAAGRDPVAERRAARELLTFGDAATDYIKHHRQGWKNAKHAEQWTSTITAYAEPLRRVRVADVTTADVVGVLRPIWSEKRETASRLRGRIEAVIGYADKIEGRERLNPARWRGHLDALLPRRGRVLGHHRALPIDEAPAFYARLCAVKGTAAVALRFAMLTAARSGEVRGATWVEVDLDAGVWTVPAERMKASKAHRVPLSARAAALLESVPHREGLLFPGTKGQLSEMTLLAVMRRMKVDAVPHGLRSTFRDWVGDRTIFPRELAEISLAHVIADSTEAAYRRGDALERRRELMETWATFVGGDA